MITVFFPQSDTSLFFLYSLYFSFFENLNFWRLFTFFKIWISWNWALSNRHPNANEQNRWRLIRRLLHLQFHYQFRVPKLKTQSSLFSVSVWKVQNKNGGNYINFWHLAVFEWSSDVNRGKNQGNNQRFLIPSNIDYIQVRPIKRSHLELFNVLHKLEFLIDFESKVLSRFQKNKIFSTIALVCR